MTPYNKFKDALERIASGSVKDPVALAKNALSRTGPKAQNLIGKTSGKLTVFEKAELTHAFGGRNKQMWFCKCACGNMKKVSTKDFNGGYVLSCGCLLTEARSLNMKRYHHRRDKVLNDEKVA